MGNDELGRGDWRVNVAEGLGVVLPGLSGQEGMVAMRFQHDSQFLFGLALAVGWGEVEVRSGLEPPSEKPAFARRRRLLHSIHGNTGRPHPCRSYGASHR